MRIPFLVGAILILIAIFGWNPFAAHRNISGLLEDGNTSFETDIKRQPNGVVRVRALTRMPGVKADMVKWWFTDYMNTTEHYKRWHPTDHVWMDWDNKTPGEIVGAVHLAHEYIGTELYKLRIQFVDPTKYIPNIKESENLSVVCAKAGDLETPMNYTTMCHIIRNTEWGAEMRSVFWLGHVSKRDGDKNIFSIEGLIANTWLARKLLLNKQFSTGLMTHAIEEMGYLADFLPTLYKDEIAKSNQQ